MNVQNITLHTGPLLIGHLLNFFLFGVEIVQFYRYYISFPTDKLWIRRFIYAILILDTLQSIFTFHSAWVIFASSWGKQDILRFPGWSWSTVPFFTGLVSFLVQCFYARRIHKLIRTKFTTLIVGSIISVALIQGLSGIVAAIQFQFVRDLSKFQTYGAITTIWLGGSALCDLLITTVIVTFLLIKITGYTPTDTVVSKIIRLTVETGLITTSAATLDVTLFLLFKDNNLHLIFCLPLAKLYSNCLLLMVNARKDRFHSSMESSEHTSAHARSASDGIRLTLSKDTATRFNQELQAFDASPPPPIKSRRESSRNSAFILKPPPRAFHRPTRTQANANFDDLAPSHLDLSNDQDSTSVRTRIMNKFTRK